MARHTIAYFFRRRIILATALSLTLFLLLVSLGFIDVDFSTPVVISNSYIPFEPPLPLPLSSKPCIAPVSDLPLTCLDAHFTNGETCYAEGTLPPVLDVLWTWVNGSDYLLDEAKRIAQSRYSPDDPDRPSRSLTQARLYRDHDELRYSMRSVLQNFRNYAGRFHLLTADFPMPNAMAESYNVTTPESWRVGQIPQWLDLNKRTTAGNWNDRRIDLSVKHHAQVFKPYDGTNFNSLAIESQFGHLGDISEFFIYMNDDIFMMNPLSPVSFYTPAFGVVLHLQSNLLVRPERLAGKNQGEWRSLAESNFLLSNRFGARHRPYVAHEAKTVSRALLHEMTMMWPESFAQSALHHFRETEGGDGDVNAMFMHSHFVVERAREALLWSWVVARIGSDDDLWGEKEATRAWTELGGVIGEKDLLVVGGWRDTLVKSRVEKELKAMGLQPQVLTSYVFSSLDGYPYSGLGVAGAPDWLKFSPDVPEGQLPRCRISYSECFVVPDFEGNPNRASDIFKHVAFRQSKCGDCIIMSLVHASGRLGLSAFLPPPGRRDLTNSFDVLEEQVPHLPLVHDWHDGDFALQSVIRPNHDVDVRVWTLRLLQRYRYVLGDTPSLFERIATPQQTARVIGGIENSKNIALLCINDDVARLDHEVSLVLKVWFDQRWKHPAAWEKG
ncbi:uncharacterized protein FIBRA_02658 [Fibroporia radiculosa]|uniref:Stealth protein CR3 conserved region 3 domain-containing protein n=1 Tax=Fibroporia radiculosa TaxID=599839 RepID=J4HVA0_9APHY|nr:uncharacterized protein FIBRA_02658 [Fibroporia radiculosa]CCM00622.1 predicted protein [Fibroporia radiculosa]